MAVSERKIAGLFAGSLSVLPLLAPLTAFFLAGVPALIGLCGYAALCLSPGKAWRSWPAPDKSATIICLGILVLSLCSALWSVSPHETLDRTFKTAPILLGLVLLVSSIKAVPGERLERGMRLLPWALLLASCVMIVEYHAHYPLYHWLNHIPWSQKINPSVMNRCMIVLGLSYFPALGIVWISFPQGLKRNLLACGLTVALAWPVVTSSSQSIQVALMGGMLAFLLFPWLRGWVWLPLIVAVTAYFYAMPLLAQAAYPYAAAVNASPYFGHGGAFGAERLDIWHFVSAKIFAKPLTGYGTEAARTLVFDTDERFFHADTVLHPHNVAMQVWLEFGVIGVTCMCLMLAFLIERLHHRFDPRAQHFLLPAFLMTLFIASTTYGMWQGWWLGLLALLVAYALMLDKICREQTPVNNQSGTRPD